jgi:DNA-binding IclR family transcriptional regulator
MLVYRDFAVRNDDRKYHAGPVLALGGEVTSDATLLRRVAMPHLRRLVDELEESCNLLVLAGDHVRFIASLECRRLLRVGNREGMVFPAHMSAGGKALLSELPIDALDEIYLGGHRLARNDGSLDFVRLKTELAQVRKNGYALNIEETEEGVTAIGRALQGHARARGAISVSMPASRFSRQSLPHIIGALTDATQRVEEDIRRANQLAESIPGSDASPG